MSQVQRETIQEFEHKKEDIGRSDEHMYKTQTLLVWLQDRYCRAGRSGPKRAKEKSVPVRPKRGKDVNQLSTAHSNRKRNFAINEFFRNNPHEELTPEQVAVKFDLSQEEASQAISYLIKRGLLEQVQLIRTKQEQA